MWKTVPEVVFRFSYWGWQQEKRKTRSFFVFLTAVRSKKNELTVYTDRDKTVFHNTTSALQVQDRFFWSQTGLVLRPTVSDHNH